MWIATYGDGLYSFNPFATDTIANKYSFDKINTKSNEINDIYLTNNEHILVATNSGLLLLSDIYFPDKFSYKRVPKSKKSIIPNIFYSITPHSETGYLIASKNGLYILKSTDKLILNKLASSKSLPYFHILNDNAENFWGNTNTSLLKMNELGIDYYNNPVFTTGINTIINDFENNIWIGTNNGLIENSLKEFQFYPSNELQKLTIRSIVVNKDNSVWLGTSTGLIKWKINTELTKENYIIPHLSISKLYKDSKQNLWVGLQNINSLYRIEHKTNKIISFNKKDGYYFNNLSSFCEDANHNIWMTSANDTGITFYSYLKKPYRKRRTKKIITGTFKYLIKNLQLPTDNFNSLYKDAYQNIWIGTKNSGLLMWNDKELQYFENNQEISNEIIKAIASDSQNNIWIATEKNGIYKYNGVFFKNISLNEGLLTKNILTIEIDNFDNIWIITKSGLQKYDQYANKFFNYTDNYYFNFQNATNASYKNKDDDIWLNSTNGLIKINPQLSIPSTAAPKCFIENILLYNKAFNYLNFSDYINEETKLPDYLIFPSEINYISFQFTGIKFSNQNELVFKYKLENFDTSWQKSIDSRIATYTNLLPGNYKFLVKCYDSSGKESNIAIQKFKIEAPLYRQIWFYILLLLAVAGTIYLIILLRVRYFKRVNVILKENYADRSKLLSSAYSNIESNIKYAKNVQNAILRNESDLAKIFTNSFVFSKPKESIGGDFFWYSRKSRKIFIAVADCIGHSVPGAFMSLIGHNLLNQTLNEIDSFDPPFILEEVSRNFERSIKNTQLEIEQNNDMDIAFCRIDRDRKEIIFSGANSTAYFIQDNKLNELKGNKRAIGQDNEIITQFSRVKIKFKQGDVLYMFTNGFADQFGGPDNKRYKSTRLKNLLVNVHDLPIIEQKKQIIEAFENWKGNNEQIDDVLIIGIRL
ncbi:MAG: SpoIIE family protein phosphatase, partial [Chlorobi bacterium]|nr:SpoIIE family protein phosphatase [Chlorobiota bacterium]